MTNEEIKALIKHDAMCVRPDIWQYHNKALDSDSEPTLLFRCETCGAVVLLKLEEAYPHLHI